MRTAIAALILSIATAALAQEQPAATPATPPKPDYSRERLTQIFSNMVPQPDKPDPTVKWNLGSIEFKALNMRWRVSFLPFLAMLPGTYRTPNPPMMDPFALTGTEFAYTPRTWRDGREISKELKRIERTERERAKLRVKTE